MLKLRWFVETFPNYLTQRCLSFKWQNCAQFISLMGDWGGGAYGLRIGTQIYGMKQTDQANQSLSL